MAQSKTLTLTAMLPFAYIESLEPYMGVVGLENFGEVVFSAINIYLARQTGQSVMREQDFHYTETPHHHGMMAVELIFSGAAGDRVIDLNNKNNGDMSPWLAELIIEWTKEIKIPPRATKPISIQDKRFG